MARDPSWLAATAIAPLARDRALSHDNSQQLHTTDIPSNGVFSDLVRYIDSPSQKPDSALCNDSRRLLISGRHQARAPSMRPSASRRRPIELPTSRHCLEKDRRRGRRPWTSMRTNLQPIDDIGERLLARRNQAGTRAISPAAANLRARPTIVRSARAFHWTALNRKHDYLKSGASAAGRKAAQTARRPRPRRRRGCANASVCSGILPSRWSRSQPISMPSRS